jgi:hypothetical protein
MGEVQNLYTISVGRPEGKNHSEDLGIDGKIKLKWGCVYWIHVAQDSDTWRALVNTVMNLWVPYTARNFLSRWATANFSDSAPLC